MNDPIDKIEGYFHSVEEFFFSSLAAATTDLPTINEAFNRLWIDVSRYGPGIPSFPEVRLPTLGDYQVPPPPPPPPPETHLSLLRNSANWVIKHPWMVSGIAVGVVGTGLFVGYNGLLARRRDFRKTQYQDSERRQVVVVLGGDSPLALPLILDLEAKGYIIIASVSNPEAVSSLERSCHGYVKALVLDPREPATIPIFLRSLISTLSRKFPTTVTGDPFVSASTQPYIQSIICLLTLPSSTPATHAPLEHISLRNAYLPYLSSTHITPLEVVQALMPLLRTEPARARDKGKKTIIMCLPAIEANVGLPFSAVQAMSAASTLRGVEVLRREVQVAALSDKSESMKNIRVIVADVGILNVGISNPHQDEIIYKSMEDWSPSEKLIYGSAFASISHSKQSTPSLWISLKAMFRNQYQHGIARRPTDVGVFVDNIASTVTEGRHHSRFGPRRLLVRIRNWVHGERFSVGAGAGTYRWASYLPSGILDVLSNIPYFLITLRDRLLPAMPFVEKPAEAPIPPPAQNVSAAATNASENPGENENSHENSETSSEVDVESISGDGNSWISVKQQPAVNTEERT